MGGEVFDVVAPPELPIYSPIYIMDDEWFAAVSHMVIGNSENQTAECGKNQWNKTTMRKTYSSAFKAKLVLQLRQGDKSLSQLASEHKVHANLLRNRRDLAVKDFTLLFENNNLAAELQANHEQQVEELYAQIGRLTAQVNWLKKIWLRP